MKQILFKNTNISYSDTGKGTAIVLLHGFLENKTMWDFYIPEFAKKNRVITIDLLGHGETECLGYVQTMEENADAVHEVLSELRIRKAIFVGHSMGGYVALAFAELYPEKIKGLVLLNSTAKADSEERKTNRDRAIKAVKQSFINFVSLSIANLFSENNRERLSSEIESVKNRSFKNTTSRNRCLTGRNENQKRPRSFIASYSLSKTINFRRKRSCLKLRRNQRTN